MICSVLGTRRFNAAYQRFLTSCDAAAFLAEIRGCQRWQNRSKWDRKDIPAPPTCSMAYMTTKTPLDADSWEYRGAYFYNAGQNADGESGMRWANNHTHFCEYQGTNYIVHHTLLLEELAGGTSGFRSIMVVLVFRSECG